MLSNPFMIRGLTPLLRRTQTNDPKSLFEKDLLLKIVEGESELNEYLKKRYKAPIEPKTWLNGSVTTTKVTNPDTSLKESPYNVVTGVNTTFENDISFGDVIFIKKSKEALQVIEVVSDTELIVSSNSNFNANSSDFFVVPEILVTCSKFITARNILMQNFSETSYTQDTKLFYEDFNKIVKPILKELREGNFIFSELLGVKKEETLNRFLSISNCNQQKNNTFLRKNNNYYN